MALGASSVQLHVGAADTIAKARRAAEASSVKTVVLGESGGALEYIAASTSASSPSADATAGASRPSNHRPRWKEAVDVNPPPPTPLQALLAKLLEGGSSPAPTTAAAAAGAAAEHDPEDVAAGRRREVDRVVREKVLPVVEKVCVVVSKLPDPTVFVLAMTLAMLCAHSFRPEMLPSSGWMGFLGACAALLPLLPVMLLWGKTDAVARLREGGDLFHHPAEGVMEGLESRVRARERAVEQGESKLAEARKALDALRKELAKDPMAATPDAILVPNKKATALIAAGALGDGASVDRRDAEAVEAKRRADAKARSQMEWKARTEEAETDLEASESIRKLMDHANIVYATHTKELKNKSGAASPAAFGADRLRAKADQAFAGLPGRRARGDGATVSTGGRSDAGGGGGVSPPSSPGMSGRVASSSNGVSHASPAPVKLSRRALGRRNRSSAKSVASGVSAASSVPAAGAGAGAGGRDSVDKSKRRLFRRKSGKAGAAGGRSVSDAGSHA